MEFCDVPESRCPSWDLLASWSWVSVVPCTLCLCIRMSLLNCCQSPDARQHRPISIVRDASMLLTAGGVSRCP
jgi:hypothetical protein